MKDKEARAAIEELEERLKARLKRLVEKSVLPGYCSKCARRTAHELLYVRTKGSKYYEVPSAQQDCIGLNVQRGERCLSCGAVYATVAHVEVQLEEQA